MKGTVGSWIRESHVLEAQVSIAYLVNSSSTVTISPRLSPTSGWFRICSRAVGRSPFRPSIKESLGGRRSLCDMVQDESVSLAKSKASSRFLTEATTKFRPACVLYAGHATQKKHLDRSPAYHNAGISAMCVHLVAPLSQHTPIDPSRFEFSSFADVVRPRMRLGVSWDP
jgi:hypothetical protein